ncbi:hypothetical protein [Flavobacterium sp. J27]|uniref:hypothetical protein n=1 Tax=Flavobacterium sp. J27 TaxID=2060419 RepID=UPI00102FB636|nr:hypothetical protein [Flavobacterium sp. J27]
MKRNKIKILFIFFSLLVSNLFSQDLKDINTLDDAQNFIILNRDVKAKLKRVTLSKGSDSLALFLDKIQELEDLGKAKLLVNKPIKAIKLNYVFFNGKEISVKEINKRRAEVLYMYKKGVSSDELVHQFTMDRNIKPGGNFGWIDEDLVDSVFISEVKKHKKGDVFIIDVPKNEWYYVVFKLFDDRQKHLIQYIEIE